MRDLLYPQEPAPLYPRPSIERPGNPHFPGGEMIPLIEPSGVVYGQAKRAWCHEGSRALHPVVHLHLIDRFGRIYLQKRSARKDLLPGYWDTAVGGHISYGEHPEEALYRSFRCWWTVIFLRMIGSANGCLCMPWWVIRIWRLTMPRYRKGSGGPGRNWTQSGIITSSRPSLNLNSCESGRDCRHCYRKSP